MRTALCFSLTLLTTPALAQTADGYVPPGILVIGERGAGVTEQSIATTYLAARPECTKRASEVARLPGEFDWQLREHRDQAYIFCMAEEFAGYGLSVIKDAPSKRSTGA